MGTYTPCAAAPWVAPFWFPVRLGSLPRMRRIGSLLVGLVLVVAACGDGAEDTIAVPSEVVAEWFEAVESGDAEKSADLVVDDSLALVLGVENQLSSEELATIVSDGVPPSVSSAYWNSFRDGFSSFAGRPLSTLAVGDYNEFEAEGAKYAAVAVTGTSGASTVVFTRFVDDGTWEVDLVATLGSGFVGHLREAHATIPTGDEGSAVRGAYREVVGPAMWAAMTAGEFGDDFARQALALVEAIETDG